MIIVEGPDGGGKSALLTRIASDLPHIPRADRFATSLGGPLENLGMLVYRDTQKQNDMDMPQLYDRHPIISEYVYGHAIREREINPYFLYPSAHTLRNVIADHSLVIWCIPPKFDVAHNVENGDQMPGVVDHIDKIYEGYSMHRVMWPGVDQLTWDYTQMGTGGKYAQILTAINRHVAGWPHYGKGQMHV